MNIDECYLNEMYDTFSREEIRLLNDLKSDKEPTKKKEAEVHKQIKLLNSLMVTTLKYRSLKKELQGNIFSS